MADTVVKLDPVVVVEEEVVELPPEVEPDRTGFIYDDNGAPIYNGTSFVRDPDEAAAILAQRAKDVENAGAVVKLEDQYQVDLAKLNARYDDKREALKSA